MVVALVTLWGALCFTAVPPCSGKVLGVSDGDTITVLSDGRGVKTCLSEIDCPEKMQLYI